MKQLKSFFLRTYGCQMNQLDSEVLAGQLLKRGLLPVDQEDQADLLLFNTCSVRDLADRKIMGKLGKLERKKKNHQLLGVCGCLAIAKKELLLRKFPHIDFVLGPNNLSDLNNLIDRVIETRQSQIQCDEKKEETLDFTSAKREGSVKALVSIIRGCNKFCTYCIVPYTRGSEFSRTPQSILEECRQLVDRGYQEITLLGQNVNSYGKDHPEWNVLFHDLLYQIDAIPGLKRLRFLTSHPNDITLQLMETFRDLPSLCEFLHFPLQAGSDRILKKMNRHYTKAQYLEKVHLLRSYVPHIALSTDIIVGFPTETEEEFQETCEMFQEVNYANAFIFAYSPRKGTPAMRWGDDVPKETKEKRLQSLLQIYHESGVKQREKLIGTTFEVLIEGKGRENNLKGRTRCWKKVVLEGPQEWIGTLQQAKVHRFIKETLIGRRIEK